MSITWTCDDPDVKRDLAAALRERRVTFWPVSVITVTSLQGCSDGVPGTWQGQRCMWRRLPRYWECYYVR